MVETCWSQTRKYRIDIHSEKEGYYAAVVYEVDKNYFKPVLFGVYITQKEIDEYKAK